jgi:hypothetical protein
MQKSTNRSLKSARQKAGKGREDRPNETQQIAHGKVQELQQEIANLNAHMEVMRKEIDALNALVRYIERREVTGQT